MLGARSLPFVGTPIGTRLCDVHNSHGWCLNLLTPPIHPHCPTCVIGKGSVRHRSLRRLGRRVVQRVRECAILLMQPAAHGAQVLWFASNGRKKPKFEPTHHQQQVRVRATVQKIGWTHFSQNSYDLDMKHVVDYDNVFYTKLEFLWK